MTASSRTGDTTTGERPDEAEERPDAGAPDAGRDGVGRDGVGQDGVGQDGVGRDDDGHDDDGHDEDLGPHAPLDGDAARRVAGAAVAVVATADAHGERDVSVLHGSSCFVRVLDGHRLAFPDEGTEPLTASRANLAEEPGVAMLLVSASGAGERRGLHLNGTARVVPASELREQYPDLPSDPVPGRATDVWVVVDVGDAYALDGDDVPPLGPGTPEATRGSGGSGTAPAGAPPRRRPVLVGVLGAAVILLVLALIGTVAVLGGTRGAAAGGTAAGPAPAPPAAPAASPPGAAGPTGPPTLFGRVTAVADVSRLTVDVAGRPVPVTVLGIDAATVPACASADAVAFARRTLQGQDVTLVPDPTVPAPAGVVRAYPVLGTQLSYTDAVIMAGWAAPAGASRYRAVFDRERAQAEQGGLGMYGPPCRP